MTSVQRIEVALVACQAAECRGLERLLPADCLPGKTAGVDWVYGALRRVVLDGDDVELVAEDLGISARSVWMWMRGVESRFLDLVRLHRHRASVADERAALPLALLVPFSAVIEEVRRRFCQAPTLDGGGLRAVLRVILRFIDALGGPVAAATLGASLFQQAVFLFRSTPTRTSLADVQRSQIGSTRMNDPAEAQSQSGDDRAVEVCPDRSPLSH